MQPSRLAVLRLRWSHLGANFVYLGAHNGDIAAALPKAIQKYTSKTLSPVALQARRNERSSKNVPPKRSPQWPCSSTIATHARKKGARLAVLRLRWSHLGANFVYLGTHNGDTTSALPKAIQKYSSKTLSPVALQPNHSRARAKKQHPRPRP